MKSYQLVEQIILSKMTPIRAKSAQWNQRYIGTWKL